MSYSRSLLSETPKTTLSAKRLSPPLCVEGFYLQVTLNLPFELLLEKFHRRRQIGLVVHLNLALVGLTFQLILIKEIEIKQHYDNKLLLLLHVLRKGQMLICINIP